MANFLDNDYSDIGPPSMPFYSADALSGQPMQPQQLPHQLPQQQQGFNPLQAYNMYTKFSGGGASGGASGGSEAMASAGPWVALAAAIAANETWANKSGRRPDDFSEHLVDMLSGKVLQRDADALGDKVGGPFGELIQYGGKMGNPSGVWDVTKESVAKPAEWANKIGDWLGGLF